MYYGKKLKTTVIMILCITLISISACGKQKSDSSSEAEERDTHVVPYLSFDYSDRRDDLSNIMEDEVLEVRWVIPDGSYRTIDEEFIYDIKKKLSEINLEPMERIEGEMPVGNSGEFYFLNGRKVLYSFYVDQLGNTFVNDKIYSNKDEFREIGDYLIGITSNDKRVEKVQ